MATVVELMAQAAAANGCRHAPYSQMAVIGTTGLTGQGSHGICFGLSVAWLESKKNGREGGFLADATNWSTSAAFSRSSLIYINQLNDKMWCKLTGFQEAQDTDGIGKSNEYRLGEMRQFTSWMSRSVGTRYFLIHVKRHAMAAYGSRTGTMKFFDPNGGVMSSTSPAHLAAAMEQYFGNENIKKHYSGVITNRPRIFIKADKYKAA